MTKPVDRRLRRARRSIIRARKFLDSLGGEDSLGPIVGALVDRLNTTVGMAEQLDEDLAAGKPVDLAAYAKLSYLQTNLTQAIMAARPASPLLSWGVRAFLDHFLAAHESIDACSSVALAEAAVSPAPAAIEMPAAPLLPVPDPPPATAAPDDEPAPSPPPLTH